MKAQGARRRAIFGSTRAKTPQRACGQAAAQRPRSRIGAGDTYGPREQRPPRRPHALGTSLASVALAGILFTVMMTALLAGIGTQADAARKPQAGRPTAQEAWALTLVNADNPLPSDFKIETMQLKGGEHVDERIAGELDRMMDDCRRAGFHPYVRSGFRTRAQQGRIMAERVAAYLEEGYSEEQARQAAADWVAQPGTSEHELGLAVDINDELDDEDMYDWLAGHAHEYGFILRYPLDKIHVTGIANEPWHYRYVGRAAASSMHETGQVLEEYLGR